MLKRQEAKARGSHLVMHFEAWEWAFPNHQMDDMPLTHSRIIHTALR